MFKSHSKNFHFCVAVGMCEFEASMKSLAQFFPVLKAEMNIKQDRHSIPHDTTRAHNRRKIVRWHLI